MACSLVQIIDPSECVGNSLSKINSNFTNLQTNVCNLLASTNIPIGGIIMYSGSLGNFTNSRGNSNADVAAYGLCDGTVFGSLSSPDLRGRFIIGQGTGTGIDNTTYTQGLTGGENTHTLTTLEMPSHAHIDPYGEEQAGGAQANNGFKGSDGTIYNFPIVPNTSGAWGSGSSDTNQSLYYTSATGGGLAHNNMPPWFALAYIIRVV